MNLEDLISKYLDGELSQAEDADLRQMIASDDDAREKFYSSVSLHVAFREDAASIETPQDIFRATEDKIMMRIMGELPDENPIPRKRRPIPVYASMVAVFLLFTIFNISDLARLETDPIMSYNLNIQNDQEINRTSVDENDAKVRENDGEFVSENNNDNAVAQVPGPVERPAMAEDAFGNNENELMNRANSEPISNNLMVAVEMPEEENLNGNLNFAAESFSNVSDIEEIETSANVLPTFSNNGFGMASGISAMNDLMMGAPGESARFAFFDNISLNDEIQISSFFGSDFYRKGINTRNNSAISHFSQSLAYNINDSKRMGIEIGYTEYSYSETMFISVPAGKVPPANTGNMVEEFNPDDGENMISYPMEIDRDKQMFWGSAFYEATLMNSSNLSLNGRLGVGASNDGPLGYLRFFGKYELVSGIYITLGGEARLFTAAMYNLSKKYSELKSTASLVYGIQFRL